MPNMSYYEGQTNFVSKFNANDDSLARISKENLVRKLIDWENELCDGLIEGFANFVNNSLVNRWLEKNGLYEEFRELMTALRKANTGIGYLSSYFNEMEENLPIIVGDGKGMITFHYPETNKKFGFIDTSALVEAERILQIMSTFFYVNYSCWSPQLNCENFKCGSGVTCLSDIGSNLPSRLANCYGYVATYVNELSRR